MSATTKYLVDLVVRKRDTSILGFWRSFLLHACIFQDIGPLPTRACMAVLEMLAEMVCTEELLRIVAFAELVYDGEMLESAVPVWLGMIGKLLAAVAAGVM